VSKSGRNSSSSKCGSNSVVIAWWRHCWCGSDVPWRLQTHLVTWFPAPCWQKVFSFTTRQQRHIKTSPRHLATLWVFLKPFAFFTLSSVRVVHARKTNEDKQNHCSSDWFLMPEYYQLRSRQYCCCVCVIIFCEQNISKRCERIFVKLARGPGTNRLDFGGNPITLSIFPPIIHASNAFLIV